jgi:mannan endo-1,4-beta-mannosidase
LQSWIESHLEDGRRILKKPVLFTEFGKSYRDPGFGTGERDNLLDMVYKHVYASARWGGAGGGAMFWQLMAEGMSSYGDGYEIVLSQNPSTAALVSGQSHKLAELTHLFTRMYEKRRLVHAHRS